MLVRRAATTRLESTGMLETLQICTAQHDDREWGARPVLHQRKHTERRGAIPFRDG